MSNGKNVGDDNQGVFPLICMSLSLSHFLLFLVSLSLSGAFVGTTISNIPVNRVYAMKNLFKLTRG